MTAGMTGLIKGFKCKACGTLYIMLLIFFMCGGYGNMSAETMPTEINTGSTDITILKESEGKSLSPFHLPDALKTSVNFWIDVYSGYSTNEVIIHDSRYLGIIFDVIRISEKTDTTGAFLLDKSIERRVNSEKDRYKKMLKSIHSKLGSRKQLNPDEQKIADHYRKIRGGKKFLAAADRVRAQPGMKERFLKGIKRSGLYLDKMKEIFRKNGLPTELTILPHVESSFDHTARSSVGAAGIWQFMKATGSMYLKINYTVDERRDPITSTRAAARLLKRNFKELGNWPMAIIAYNYGLGGMKRAKRRVGKEVMSVINGYKSPLFGFASRNFYSEFLAALTVTGNVKKYFGEVESASPLEFETITLKNFIDIDDLSKYLQIDKKVISRYNPALRTPVLESEKLVPEEYTLNLPLKKGKKNTELLALIPKKLFKKHQIRSAWYRVMPGDNLSKISRRFNTTVALLMEINGIRNAGKIYAGQILQLPSKNRSMKTTEKAAPNQPLTRTAALTGEEGERVQ